MTIPKNIGGLSHWRVWMLNCSYYKFNFRLCHLMTWKYLVRFFSLPLPWASLPYRVILTAIPVLEWTQIIILGLGSGLIDVSVWLFLHRHFLEPVTLLKIVFSLCCNVSPATAKPYGILVKLSMWNGVLNAVKDELALWGSVW